VQLGEGGAYCPQTGPIAVDAEGAWETVARVGTNSELGPFLMPQPLTHRTAKLSTLELSVDFINPPTVGSPGHGYHELSPGRIS